MADAKTLSRPLTKSRFKLAVECPRKLTYQAQPSRYPTTDSQDEFAEQRRLSGHAVGELARRMYPETINITARERADQLAETAALISRDEVTVAEGTFTVDNLLVRVDLLVKKGRDVRLIEVKSKSFDSSKNQWFGKGRRVKPDWLPYVQDVAFQTYLLRRIHPDWKVTPVLMLIDPRARCTIEGLGHRIRALESGRTLVVSVDPTLRLDELREPLLQEHDVTEQVASILNGTIASPEGEEAFAEFVSRIAARLERGEEAPPIARSCCKECEYYVEPSQQSAEHRSGWAECMSQLIGREVTIPREESVFGLFDDKARLGLAQLKRGRLLLTELDLGPLEAVDASDRISRSERQHMQVESLRAGGPRRVLRSGPLRRALSTLRFPLHFIDFETAQPVLPFHGGCRPNQRLLFQFSHHVLSEAGELTHSECLVDTPGVPPSAPVVRALIAALASDNGTVLHWHRYESTILDSLSRDLTEGAERDRVELINSISNLKTRLFDLGGTVADFAFFANTGGSSSIKDVLPAVLEQSEHLRARYRRPVYASRNFPVNWVWLQLEGDRVLDPYMLLVRAEAASEPPGTRLADATTPSVVHEGGGAALAYATLQQPHLPETDRARLRRQLLRYCELDTLAMVMAFEALREWVSAPREKAHAPSAGV